VRGRGGEEGLVGGLDAHTHKEGKRERRRERRREGGRGGGREGTYLCARPAAERRV